MATPIDFKNLSSCLPLVAKTRKPILIRGPHGIGKSEIIYQFAKRAREILGLKPNTKAYQRNWNLEANEMLVVERRASQMPDAGDIMGLPEMDGDVTKFSPMEWFKIACDHPVVLFFDEVDRANQDVRQALFELTDSRKIAGRQLHPDTIVIACVNGGEGESHYIVGEMDPAELDRWTVFDVEPTVEDWISWAKDNVDPIIIDFIKQNRSSLEHKGEFEPNKKYPSRRSWKRVSDTLAPTGLLQDPFETVGGKKRINVALYYVTQGYVGMESANLFSDFVKNYKHNITVEDILDGSRKDAYEKLDNVQQIALIEKLEEAPRLKEKLSQDELQNLGEFAFSVAHELLMKIWDAVSSHPDNGRAFHKVKVGGKSLVAYMQQVMTGKVKDK